MASLNQLQIIGYLGKDPQLRATPAGDPIVALSVATNDKHKDLSGKMVERTEWHRIIFFGRQAEVCAQYLKRGSEVFIQGRLRTRDYTDRDGQARRVVEVLGDKMLMLGAARVHPSEAGSAPSSGGPSADLADDIPF